MKAINLKLYIIIWLLVIAVMILVDSRPYDNTDNKANEERSGMQLYTDHLTGCQYLGGGLLVGGITPRLDGRGQQVGCRQ